LFTNPALFTAPTLSATGQRRKPVAAAGSANIIIVFCDDMGYGDIGKYGAIGYNTPNIDGWPGHAVYAILCSRSGLFRLAG
jgi:hypothetical protein